MSLASLSHGLGEGLWRIPRAAPAVLGVVLLIAAALKTHQLATGPSGENSLFTSRWFQIGLVEFESVLALWLLSGAYPRQARLTALATFACFSVVSLSQAFAGKVSCSCFGELPLRPWYAFLFDVAAVSALWRWRSPKVNTCSFGGAAAVRGLSASRRWVCYSSSPARRQRLWPSSVLPVL
jgi:hypothetical protein